MGDFFSGPKTQTSSTEKVDMGPSKFQRPFLDDAFGAAKDIYASSKDTPFYQGDTYAGMSAAQREAMDRMGNFASGQGFDTGQSISSLGQRMVAGAGDKAMTNLDRFTAMAGEDATGANIAAAGRYADNPHVQGMIDANARDVTRNLYENEIPGIDRAAAASGNINSSRTGIASGVAQRGAADRIGDISASIRGDAYNRGLTLAQNDRSTSLDAYGQAARGYSDLTGQGLSAIGQGMDMSYDGLGRQMDVNSMDQADRQGEMDAAFKKWAGNDTRKMDLLSRYQSIVGGNQWGQSGTTSSKGTSTQSGGGFQQLLSAGAAVGAAYAGCDRRLKHNITLLGYLEDGLGLYGYLYRQDLSDEFGLMLPKGFQIGPMADEVAELRPHAMGPELNGGFASINLAAL